MKAILFYIYFLLILLIPAISNALDLINEPYQITKTPFDNFDADISKNGEFMVFSSLKSENKDLWIKFLDQIDIQPDVQLTVHSASDTESSISPDGTKVAFVSTRFDPKGDILVLDIKDATNKKYDSIFNVTDISSFDRSPAWISDDEIIFSSKGRLEMFFNIYLYNITSRKKKNITSDLLNFGAVSPKVSIDKKYITFTAKRSKNDSDIMIIRVSDKKLAFLTKGNGIDGYPSFGEDSQTIYFSRYDTDTNRNGNVSLNDNSSVWSLNFKDDIFDNNNPVIMSRRLTSYESYDQFPVFYNDNVYYTSLHNGINSIFRIGKEGMVSKGKSLEDAIKLSGNICSFYKNDKGKCILSYYNLLSEFYHAKDRESLSFANYTIANIYYDDKNLYNAKYEFNKVISNYKDSSIYRGMSEIKLVLIDFEAVKFKEKDIFFRVAKESISKLEDIVKRQESKNEVSATALIEIGNIYIYLKDHLSALNIYKKVLLEYPQFRSILARAQFSKNRIYIGLGEDEKIINVFLNVIKEYPEEKKWVKKASNEIIKVYESEDDFNKKIFNIRELIKKYNDLKILVSMAQNRVGELYYGINENKKALLEFKKTITDYPEIEDEVDIANFNIAKIYFEDGEYKKSLKLYKRMVKDNVEKRDVYNLARNSFIDRTLNKGESEFKVKEIRLAIKTYKSLINFDYNLVKAHRGLITSYATIGEIDKSIKFYSEKVLSNRKDHVSLYALGLSKTYEGKNDFSDSLKLIKEALSIDSQISFYHQTLGWIYEQNEMLLKKGSFLELALSEYESAYVLTDPKDTKSRGDLILNIGHAYFNLGNFKAAHRFYKKRFDLNLTFLSNVTEFMFYKRFGESAFKSGESIKAIDMYEKAVELTEEKNYDLLLELSDRLALAYFDLTRYSDAVDQYSKSLELNEKSKDEKRKNINRSRILRNSANALYNLSLEDSSNADKQGLFNALSKYLESLENIEKFGTVGKVKTKGLISIEVGVGEDQSTAARGFSLKDEKKLIFTYIGKIYERVGNFKKATKYYEKKLSFIPKKLKVSANIPVLTEKAVILNQIGYFYFNLGDEEKGLANFKESLELCKALKNKFGIVVNLQNITKIYLDRFDNSSEYADRINPPYDILESAIGLLEKLKVYETKDKDLQSNLTAMLNNIGLLEYHSFILSDDRILKGDNQRKDYEQQVKNSLSKIGESYKKLDLAYKYINKAFTISNNEDTDKGILNTLKYNLLQIELLRGNGKKTSAKREKDLLPSDFSDLEWKLLFLKSQVAIDENADLINKSFELLKKNIPSKNYYSDKSGDVKFLENLYKQAAVKSLNKGDVYNALMLSEKGVSNIFSKQVDIKSLKPKREIDREYFEMFYEALSNDNKEEAKDYKNLILEELPDLSNVLFETALEPEIVQEIILDEDIIVKFLLYKNYILRWVITKEDILGDSFKVTSNVMSLLKRKGSLKENDLTEVSNLLFNGLSDKFNGKKRIYIVTTDRLLERLPWNMFYIDKKVIVENYDLVFNYSLEHLFLSFNKKSLFSKNILTVSSDFPQTVNLSEDQNMRNALIDGTVNADILHFDGLLKLNGDSLNKSVVTVSDLNKMEEVQTVSDFLNTKYVSKMAVFNNIKFIHDDKNYTSQTVYLNNILLYAGFPHTLLNIRGFNNEYNNEFMSEFYKNLKKKPSSLSLRLAQIFMRKKYPDNLLWEGYRLYGYGGMNDAERAEYAKNTYMDNLTSAVESFKESKWQKAITFFENALTLASITKDNTHIEDIYKTLAEASFNLKKYDKAAKYEDLLVSIRRKKEDPEILAEALYFSSVIYSYLEDYDNSAKRMNEAIKIYTEYEILDKLAQSFATLGIIEEERSSYDKALSSFESSALLNEEMGENLLIGKQMRRLGRIYYLRLNKYSEALKFFNRAKEVFEKEDNKNELIESYLEIGLTYERLGDFNSSLSFYEKGLLLSLTSKYKVGETKALIYKANSYWFMGDYQNAFKNVKGAIKIASGNNDKQNLTFSYNLLGLMYWTLNDQEKALLNLDESLALAKEINSKIDIASAYNNIGLVYRKGKEYEKSIKFFNMAKELDTKLKSKWGIAYDERNIGISLLRMERISEATPHITKAYNLSKSIGNRINEVKALLELSNISFKIGDYDKANKLYEDTFTLSDKLNIPEVSWRAKRGLALCYVKKDEREKAFIKYKESVEIIESMRAAIKIEEFKNSFLDNKQDTYEEIVTLLLDLKRPKEAFNFSERARARSFIDILGNQKLDLKNDVSKEMYGRLKTLSGRIRVMEETLKNSSHDDALEVNAKLIALRNNYKDLLVEVKLENPELSTFVSVDPLKVEDVYSLLDSDTVLIEFLTTKDEIICWVVKNGSLNVTRTKYDNKLLVKKVKRYRSLLQNLEPLSVESRELYDLILKPVEKYIEGDYYLGIVPHGILHYLSFASLKKGDTYLIEDYPLFFTPSASVLKFTLKGKRKLDKSKLKVLAIGNPDLGSFNYDLPLSELEAKSIKWNFPEIDILTKERAKESWIQENIGNYDIIHIASHGEFDDVNPLFSSLKLVKDITEDGNLEVNEIFSLDLKAELVSLSACQTGLGAITKGDEVIGLNRAFFYAGTKSIISSLWRVSDISTAVIMKHFYRNYTTKDKAKSLRLAQLLVKRYYPHPSYWAGFSLSGEYR